ncbi:MAG: hypothetical protein KME40_11740 [Komarekiella atlantica HA4396-MV6]|nr:hypothetical protein [Komarekiella atlantica HA4396-MV6]
MILFIFLILAGVGQILSTRLVEVTEITWIIGQYLTASGESVFAYSVF